MRGVSLRASEQFNKSGVVHWQMINYEWDLVCEMQAKLWNEK